MTRSLSNSAIVGGIGRFQKPKPVPRPSPSSRRYRTHTSTEDSHRRGPGGSRDSELQSRQIGWSRRFGFPDRARREADERRERFETTYPAGGPKTRLTVCQLAISRTSCATWMVKAGADPKSVQGQMRHSRISTTMDIYAQFVPEGQRRRSAAIGVRERSVLVHYGPINMEFSSGTGKTRQVLRRLVELVGIEPTASSLRTTRSPS